MIKLLADCSLSHKDYVILQSIPTYMLRRIATLCLFLICVVVALAAAKGKFTLVIDAGHGGKDPGTMTKNSKEKHIALNVALAFGRYVEQNCPDVRVIYTRKNDVFIPLHERAAIANRNKADAFISIHVNSVASKKPIVGMETYTMGMRRSDEKLSAAQQENEVVLIEDGYKQHYSGYDPHSPESMFIFDLLNEKNMAESVELARLIQRYTCSTANRPNKGVKQDAFLVLRETSMPACLIELGYISTPSEERYLTNKVNVDQMGRGIYQAFVAYKNRKSGHGAAPASQSEARPTAPAPQPEARPAASAQQVKKEMVEDSVKEDGRVETAPQSAKPAALEPPVFKVQILAADRKLAAKDQRLKGLTGVSAYKENGMWKHTVGASTDYNEIYNLRKQILNKFPQAFIIAFRNGEKMDVNAAISEFKKNRNRK